jgi:hypothetical protein
MGQKFSALPSATDFIRENPFEKHRDDLEQHRMNNNFLGHTMFWKNSDQLPTKHIYHTRNVEYRNMKMMFLEMLMYLMWLLGLTVYVVSLSSNVEFEMKEQQQAFWKVCKDNGEGVLPTCSVPHPGGVDGFFRYMRETFTNIVFNEEEVYPKLFDQDFLYDLDETSVEWHPRYLGDTRTTVLLGAVRARQLRVLPNRGCLLPENLTEAQPRCFSSFDAARQSKKFYAKRRIPGYILNCYVHQPQNRTEMGAMTGKFATYPGEGFMVDFPLNRTLMRNMLRDLQEWEWVDVQTRAIVIEVNTFNPNVNIVAVNRILFEFSPTGQLRPMHEVFALPTRFLTVSIGEDGGTLFALQLIVVVGVIFFAIYQIVLIYKDPISYFQYTWNIVDCVNLGLFFSYMFFRMDIMTKYGNDNNLQPELAGMPLVYMPYVQLESAFYSCQAVLAWYCLFSWTKVFKYLSLSKTFRVLIGTLESCCFQLFIFSFLYLSITVGFTIAFVIGFGAADTTDGLYASFGGCFFTLFFMLVGGVNLEPILGRQSVSYMTNWVLRYLLFCAYMVLIALLLFNFFMSIVIDTYTRVNIQLFGNDRTADQRKNPCMVFLYTYYYKFRGVHLVKDDEENIGHPDEQYVELNLLPGFLADAWKTKQAALLEMIQDSEMKANETREKARNEANSTSVSKLGRRLSLGSKNTPGSKSIAVEAAQSQLPTLNMKVISRLQLQRLMDDAPEIGEVLGAKRAIDVIRRFRTERGPDPYTEITRLQENVILKLDQLERVGLNLEFTEVESLRMVSNGLNDALTDVENQWRAELTQLLESCSAISNHLIDLTDRLAACTEKHNEIARDIQTT